jgi:hypothetical protein
MVRVVCGRCEGILTVFGEKQFVERDARMARGILKRQTCWWCFRKVLVELRLRSELQSPNPKVPSR